MRQTSQDCSVPSIVNPLCPLWPASQRGGLCEHHLVHLRRASAASWRRSLCARLWTTLMHHHIKDISKVHSSRIVSRATMTLSLAFRFNFSRRLFNKQRPSRNSHPEAQRKEVSLVSQVSMRPVPPFPLHFFRASSACPREKTPTSSRCLRTLLSGNGLSITLTECCREATEDECFSSQWLREA